MPPTPSWLCATGSIIFGTKPPTSVPVVSVRYLPTVPLELASPFGNDADFEFSRRRDVSRPSDRSPPPPPPPAAGGGGGDSPRHRVRHERELAGGARRRDQHVRR